VQLPFGDPTATRAGDSIAFVSGACKRDRWRDCTNAT